MTRGFPIVLTLLCVVLTSAAARAQAIDGGDWKRFLTARAHYKQNCAPCHGLKGAAPLTYAPSFALGEGLNLEFGLLLLTLQEGGLYMPPWKALFDYEEQEWLVRYAQVLPADNVFRQHCSACHTETVPALPAGIPRGRALQDYDGLIHVTRGQDVPRTWTGKDQLDVIRMIRTLAGESQDPPR